MRKLIVLVFVVLVIVAGGTSYYYYLDNSKTDIAYLASDRPTLTVLNTSYEEVEIPRGGKVVAKIKESIINGDIYHEFTYEDQEAMGDEVYYVKNDDLVFSLGDVVRETEMVVYRVAAIYKDIDGSLIYDRPLEPGEVVEVIGFNEIAEDGTVDYYKIRIDDIEGFVNSKYLCYEGEEAIAEYAAIHSGREDLYGGGDAASLDYFPNEKLQSADNVMPEYVKAVYLNAEAVKNIDEYITMAQGSDVNAFVVDIRDTDVISYASKIMKDYSKSSYDHAFMSFEEYQKQMEKVKEAGIYLIGRITVFKDTYYAKDNPDEAIYDNTKEAIFYYGGAYWPTPYSRKAWEYNVLLAKEAVVEMGFNEIQFDYVRFPDLIYNYEKNGEIDMRNQHNETKAQAIQRFLMYACDELHKVDAYVSADTFGETSNSYVAAYGQYWPAISNVVDVISAMPYPDHFNAHDYGIKEVVWQVPQKLLSIWAAQAAVRQTEIPTPAIDRTWIQGYDSIKSPYVVYNADKIYEQAQGLKEGGLNGGFIVWNGSASLAKYESYASAFERLE